MRKRTFAFIFLAALAVLVSAFGLSSARYSSTVQVKQTLDYARTIGALSLFEPENVIGYPDKVYDAEEKCFRISANKPGCDNIKFAVDNFVTHEETEYINDIDTDCFVRVVPATDGVLPIDYVAYKEDQVTYDANNDPIINEEYECTEVDGVKYYGGDDFKLATVKNENSFVFSMQVIWKSSSDRTLGLHSFNAQLVRQRADGSFTVICSVPLRFRFDVILDYYVCGDRIGSELVESNVDTLNFNSSLPEHHILEYASSAAWGWAAAPNGICTVDDSLAQYPVQVVMLDTRKVAVTVVYRDRTRPIMNDAGVFTGVFTEVSRQVLQIDKGKETIIDFTSQSSLNALEITLPQMEYKDATGKVVATYNPKYIAAHCDVAAWANDSFTGINTETGKEETHPVFYQDYVKIPQDNTTVHKTELTVYIAPEKEYTVTAEIVDSGGNLLNTVAFTSTNGIITVTQAYLRTLHSSLATKNSFGVSTKNIYGSLHEEGFVYVQVSGSWQTNDVKIDCFRMGQFENSTNVWYDNGFCLVNPNIKLYIQSYGW